MRAGRAFAGLGAILVAALSLAAWRVGWDDLWASPDQRGRRLYDHGRYAEAAEVFTDPMWRGVAQMRAGDFKAAEASFAGVDSAEAAFNQGDALVMLGKYSQAAARFGRALDLRPGWPQAEANRRIAEARAERLKAPGADAGDQREGADAVVFDKDAKHPGGEETRTDGAAMNDEAARALWLKRVRTRPADFLRARFAAQLEEQDRAAKGSTEGAAEGASKRSDGRP